MHFAFRKYPLILSTVSSNLRYNSIVCNAMQIELHHSISIEVFSHRTQSHRIALQAQLPNAIKKSDSLIVIVLQRKRHNPNILLNIRGIRNPCFCFCFCCFFSP